MGLRAAQISVEYLIIVGVVVFLIIVPAAIFLSSFARDTMHGTLGSETTNELGEGLTDNAKQVYYLGLYAQKKVTLPIPENVEQVYILELIESPEEVYYYIGVRVNDGSSAVNSFYQSDAPLTSLIGGDVVDTDLSSFIPECASATCNFYSFTGNVIKPGKKVFHLETVNDEGTVKVQVVPAAG